MPNVPSLFNNNNDINNNINQNQPQNNNIFDNNLQINENQNINFTISSSQNEKEEPKKKSLGEILFNKIKEAKENELLSYNSEYIQQKQDEASKNQKNKYKTYFEISSANNININPNKNIGSIKEYFHKNSFSNFTSRKVKSNSFDISFSFNRDNNNNNLIPNFETSFTKKLSLNNTLIKPHKKRMKITCQINEPAKASFTILIGKKVEMKKLRKTICEQLKKKNKIYSELNINGFFLMNKNYSIIPEFGLVENTNLSDGDYIVIILKDSLKKAQDNE